MGARICVTADPVWSDPSIEGIEVSDDKWHLNVDQYQNFIRGAAGIELTNEISESDCYRIGNRLQALVQEHKRNGEWEPRLAEEYAVIESLEEFLWVARFFQTCHECTDAGEPCC